MSWISGGALITGLVAGVVALIVVFILNAIAPIVPEGFGWALGVTVVTAFFAGYLGHIAGVRARSRS